MGNCCKKYIKGKNNPDKNMMEENNSNKNNWVNTLKNFSNNDVPDFSLENIDTLCKVVDIYDADTFRVIFFKNKGDLEPMKVKVRAAGFNAAEMYPLKSHPNREEEMKKARLARNRLFQLVTDVEIEIKNIKYTNKEIDNLILNNKKLVYIKFGKFDKYGRVLGTLYTDENKQLSINQILINENHAVAYDGGKRDKNSLTVKE